MKFIKYLIGLYREHKLIVTRYVQNVRHWHEYKHANVLATCQPRRQSATAPSYATHTADLSQLINVMNSGFIHTLLNDIPNDIIYWIEV